MLEIYGDIDGCRFCGCLIHNKELCVEIRDENGELSGFAHKPCLKLYELETKFEERVNDAYNDGRESMWEEIKNNFDDTTNSVKNSLFGNIIVRRS